jgi:Flp pilus assembly protein TadG
MHRATPTVRRRLLHSLPRGAAIVEFALVMPFLILLMVGLFDLGLGFWQYMQVQAAAEAGAQYAARYPFPWVTTTAIPAITTAITSATGTPGISADPAPSQVCRCPDGGTLTPVACNDTCPSGSRPGVYALVSARLSYSPVLPYPGLPDPLTLNGHAYRRIQ